MMAIPRNGSSIRRRLCLLVACLLALTAARSSSEKGSPDPAPTAAISRTVRDAMTEVHLRAVIVRVSVDGRDVIREAFGESIASVKATPDMHLRNGGVAIAYVATLLFKLVDDKKVSLDDLASKWVPEIPNSDRVTLGQLAHMTSGYADYVQAPAFGPEHYDDPFRRYTPEELIAFANPRTLLYEPGTNWSYAHTNYLILGLALERITGKPMDELMRDELLRPLGLDDTTDPGSAALPEPALHAFTSERKDLLEIPASKPFFEESTYWDPSWSITRGAVQTSTIDDVHDLAISVLGGKLLSEASYQRMVSPELRGKTTILPQCPTCHLMDEYYTAVIGSVMTGDWLLRTMSMSGYNGAQAYNPSKKIAIAVFATYEQAFYENPKPGNQAEVLFRQIGAIVAPTAAPPVR